MLVLRRQIAEALCDLDLAIFLDPKNIESYLVRGSPRIANGQYDLAIADIDRVIRAQPANARAYDTCAAALFGKKDYPAAIESASCAIELAAGKRALLRGGVRRPWQVQFALGKLDEAIGDWHAGHRARPCLRRRPRDAR